MKYYLLLGGEIKGPFPLAIVCEMLAAGAIQETTLVAHEGANGWQPVGETVHSNGTSDRFEISQIAVIIVRNWAHRIIHQMRGRPIVMGIVASISAVMLVGSILVYQEQNRDSRLAASQRGPERGDGGNYQTNRADGRVIKRFEEAYGVTHRLGKKSGLNDLEILMAAVYATDWSGATTSLRNAVKEFQSIKNGESSESRNKKMKKMMTIIDCY